MQNIGTVLFFDRFKGFGFLETSVGQDLFFHISAIVMPRPAGARRLEKGQQVSYELGTNPKCGRVIAVNVVPINGSDGQ